MSGQVASDVQELRLFGKNAGLSDITVDYLLAQSFLTLNHLQSLDEDDFVKLEVPLGEKVLLKAKVRELNGIPTKEGSSRRAHFKHEYHHASYKNNDTVTSWIKGTFIITQSRIVFVPDQAEATFVVGYDDVYHVEKSDSAIKLWPFKTNAINVFSKNVKHKFHLGSLRDSAYEKLSLFFENKIFEIKD